MSKKFISTLQIISLLFKSLNVLSLFLIVYLLYNNEYYSFESPLQFLNNYGYYLLAVIGIVNIVTLILKYKNLIYTLFSLPFTGGMPFLGIKLFNLESNKLDSFSLKSYLNVIRKYTDDEKISTVLNLLSRNNIELTDDFKSEILNQSKMSSVKELTNEFIRSTLEKNNKIQRLVSENKKVEDSMELELSEIKQLLIDFKSKYPNVEFKSIDKTTSSSFILDWLYTIYQMVPYLLTFISIMGILYIIYGLYYYFFGTNEVFSSLYGIINNYYMFNRNSTDISSNLNDGINTASSSISLLAKNAKEITSHSENVCELLDAQNNKILSMDEKINSINKSLFDHIKEFKKGDFNNRLNNIGTITVEYIKANDDRLSFLNTNLFEFFKQISVLNLDLEDEKAMEALVVIFKKICKHKNISSTQIQGLIKDINER